MSPVEFKAGDFENVLNTECNTVSFIEKKDFIGGVPKGFRTSKSDFVYYLVC